MEMIVVFAAPNIMAIKANNGTTENTDILYCSSMSASPPGWGRRTIGNPYGRPPWKPFLRRRVVCVQKKGLQSDAPFWIKFLKIANGVLVTAIFGSRTSHTSLLRP